MLIIVRHGRTVANAEGLLQGHVDNPLDEVGLAQAHDVARALSSLERPRVLSSSLLRARQTAEVIAGAAAVEIDDRFIELHYGDLDGVPVRSVPQETWSKWRSDPDFAPPGGESLAALQARVEGACAELGAEAAERDVVVVTHVSPIKAVVAWALGVGPETSWRMYVGQATITRIRTGGAAPSLLSFNEIAHLVVP